MNHRTWIKKTLFELDRQGWKYRHGSKHVVVYPLSKEFRPFTISVSPSDIHAQENALKELRKSGFKG